MTSIQCQSLITQISCGKEHLIALTKEGRIFTMGKSTRGQLGQGSTASHDTLQLVDVLEPLRFVQVEAGGWHSLVLSGMNNIVIIKTTCFLGLTHFSNTAIHLKAEEIFNLNRSKGPFQNIVNCIITVEIS